MSQTLIDLTVLQHDSIIRQLQEEQAATIQQFQKEQAATIQQSQENHAAIIRQLQEEKTARIQQQTEINKLKEELTETNLKILFLDIGGTGMQKVPQECKKCHKILLF